MAPNVDGSERTRNEVDLTANPPTSSEHGSIVEKGADSAANESGSVPDRDGIEVLAHVDITWRSLTSPDIRMLPIACVILSSIAKFARLGKVDHHLLHLGSIGRYSWLWGKVSPKNSLSCNTSHCGLLNTLHCPSR